MVRYSVLLLKLLHGKCIVCAKDLFFCLLVHVELLNLVPFMIKLYYHSVFPWGGFDLAVLCTHFTQTQIKCNGTSMVEYSSILYLLRWCGQNSHTMCSKIRWWSTACMYRDIFLSLADSDNHSYLEKKKAHLQKRLKTHVFSYSW